MYGEERLKEMIRKFSHLPAKEIITGILEDVSAFGKGMPQYDDISLLVLKAV